MKKAPASTRATTVEPSRTVKARVPGSTFLALRPRGSWLARRMSPARIARRTGVPTSTSARWDFELGRRAVETALHDAGIGSVPVTMAVKKFSKPASCASVSCAGTSITSCGVPDASDAALIEHDDAFAEREDLAVRVGHVQDGNVVRRVPGAQIVDDPRLRRVIERRQRLVEQQHVRIGDQRARQRHALTFAAGNRVRPPGEQVVDAETLGRRDDLCVAFGGAEMGDAVRQVVIHRQVRKERELLKDVADSSDVVPRC